MMHGQKISDNEIYLLIKYIKSVLWRVAKRRSYIEDARCLKVDLFIRAVSKSVFRFAARYEAFNALIECTVLIAPMYCITTEIRKLAFFVLMW